MDTNDTQSMKRGVPYKRVIKTLACDNIQGHFYLIKLNLTQVTDTGSFMSSDTMHLFTPKELKSARERFLVEAVNVECADNSQLLGYAHPHAYVNKYGREVVRYMCKYLGDCVGYNRCGGICGFFTPREMKRSEERYHVYIAKGLKGLKLRFKSWLKHALRIV